MCELNAILVDGDERKSIMESVTRIIVDGDSIELYGILGDRQIVSGTIKEVDLTKGETIILAK
ncbi:CooT family nickel-binding protein [Methanolobus sp. ZRKC3]|uniref:CooT family nickel-binding protein n=1 Tax=Methanolobus sp. ZRKC3 TaxID=3125786 RepID=UPI00325469EC